MRMKSVVLAALPICLLPFAALAKGPAINVGVDITSNYVDEGATVSNNKPAIQPHIELSSGIFYGGLWFSNIVSGADTTESDIYLGVTGDLGGGSNGLSYNVNYTRVYYNATGDQGGTLEATINYAPSDPVSFGLSVSNDLVGGPVGLELGADYTFANGFGLSSEVGQSLASGSNAYWSIAVSKKITDETSLEFGYHDINGSTPLYTAMFSFDTDLNQVRDN